MEELRQWLTRQDVKQIGRDSVEKLLSIDLGRDPNRAIYINPETFLSPADGVILYSRVVNPTEDIIEVKGEHYTVNELLREELRVPCLVQGIFMTVRDVHINRIPTSGYLQYDKLPTLKVTNLSMRPVEKHILETLGVDYQQLKYALYNERTKNRIFSPWIDQVYYLVQIADFEVDVIAHFDEKQNKYYTQGERFSLVRMGSQVDLIIPFLNPSVTFTSMVDDKVMWHVEGGVDQLVKVVKRR